MTCPIPVFPASSPWKVIITLGFPGGSAGTESACNAGDLDSISGFGGSPGEENSFPLQYSGLENCMDYIAHGVAKSQTQLSDFHFFFHPLEGCHHIPFY